MKKRGSLAAAALWLCLAATAQAQTASVARGAIDKTVYGAGEILPASQPGVYARIDAKVVEWYAGMGDSVKAGDVLMKLEDDALAAQAAQLEYDIQMAQRDVLYTKTHEQYKYRPVLDRDGRQRLDVNTREPLMEKYSDEITVRAPCDGRVMAVYIEAGDDALAEYREHGSIVLLSTDGRMKVELDDTEGAGLAYDQQVRVVGEGVDTTGNVIRLTRRGTQATIQILSDEYPIDTPVQVLTMEGEAIGEGVLEVNKPMAVSAYGGTVKGVMWNVKVGSYLKRYDVIARIDWDETPLFYDNDTALWAYTKKKIELERVREKLEDLAIVAPCDGVIASVDVEEGQSVTSGTKVMRIVESGAGMEIVLRIDELDIPLVAPGQPVKLSVDALPQVTLEGEVEKIAPLGNTETAVTMYDVYVTVTGEIDPRVLGGMNVSGEILVSREKDALLLPAQAISQGEDGWIAQLKSGEIRPVTLGVTTDSQVQILSGLAVGDVVVY